MEGMDNLRGEVLGKLHDDIAKSYKLATTSNDSELKSELKKVLSDYEKFMNDNIKSDELINTLEKYLHWQNERKEKRLKKEKKQVTCIKVTDEEANEVARAKAVVASLGGYRSQSPPPPSAGTETALARLDLEPGDYFKASPGVELTDFERRKVEPPPPVVSPTPTLVGQHKNSQRPVIPKQSRVHLYPGFPRKQENQSIEQYNLNVIEYWQEWKKIKRKNALKKFHQNKKQQ